jgi:hypothetical protein
LQVADLIQYFRSKDNFITLAREADVEVLAGMACHGFGKYLFQIIVAAGGFVVGAIQNFYTGGFG